MDDVCSVIIGLCDCGSDYKSWVLVCKSWNDTLVRSFPMAKTIFGNKIINIIDDSGILEAINSDGLMRDLIKNNPYIPHCWKIENLSTDCIVDLSFPPLYPLLGTVSTSELESANQDLSLLSHSQIVNLISNINPKLYRLLAFNILIKKDWIK